MENKTEKTVNTANNQSPEAMQAAGDSQGTPSKSQGKLISWKRELCILLLGIVSGAAIFAIYSFLMIRNQVTTTCENYLQQNLLLVYESNVPYQEALLQFEKNAASLPGWSVNREYCQMPGDVTVFKLCHKEYAKRLLSTEQRKNIAAILPCSFALYATSNGKTRLVRINAPLVEKIIDGDETATFEKHIMAEQEVLLKMCGFKPVKE